MAYFTTSNPANTKMFPQLDNQNLRVSSIKLTITFNIVCNGVFRFIQLITMKMNKTSIEVGLTSRSIKTLCRFLFSYTFFNENTDKIK